MECCILVSSVTAYNFLNNLMLTVFSNQIFFQQRMAQEVLTHLKEHPDAWTRVDTILEFSQNMNTKVRKWTFIYLVFLFLPFINFEEGISFLAVDFLDSNHIFLTVLFAKLALSKNCKWKNIQNSFYIAKSFSLPLPFSFFEDELIWIHRIGCFKAHTSIMPVPKIGIVSI